MKRQLKKVGGMMIVLVAALASTPAFADLVLIGMFSGGVATLPGQVGLMNLDAAGSVTVAGPRNVSVGSVNMFADGISVGGGSAQFISQARVVQGGGQVSVATITSAALQGRGQLITSASGNFQRF